MDIKQKWTVPMKNNIGGVMKAAADPFNPSVFYVTDGLFSAYSGIRFRKLSVETGEELANIVTRDCARCIYLNQEYIYVFLSKRILQLHRSDFTIAHTYKEKIPHCTDYADSAGGDIFLLANHNADSLSVFDFCTCRTRRKKIGGCCGIFKTESDTFFIFNYDSILEYSLADNKLNKLTDTERYTQCARGKSGRAYLLCGGVQYSTTIIVSAEYKILIYSFTPETTLEKVVSIPEEICSQLCNAMRFCLSEDERILYLFDSRTLWIYSIHEDRILFRYTFEGECIHNVLPERSFVVTRNPEPGVEHRVSGWEILS